MTFVESYINNMENEKKPIVELDIADVASLVQQLQALIVVNQKKKELYDKLIKIHRRVNREMANKNMVAKKFLTVCKRMIKSGKVDMKKLRTMSREYSHVNNILTFEQKLYEQTKDNVAIHKRPSR